MSNGKLTERQRRFAALFASGLNGVQSYSGAYEITPRTRDKRRQLAARACALRAKPAIAALIADLREAGTPCSPALPLDCEGSGTQVPAPLPSTSAATALVQPADDRPRQPADETEPATTLLEALDQMTGAALPMLECGELRRLGVMLHHWLELAALELDRRRGGERLLQAGPAGEPPMPIPA